MICKICSPLFMQYIKELWELFLWYWCNSIITIMLVKWHWVIRGKINRCKTTVNQNKTEHWTILFWMHSAKFIHKWVVIYSCLEQMCFMPTAGPTFEIWLCLFPANKRKCYMRKAFSQQALIGGFMNLSSLLILHRPCCHEILIAFCVLN